MKILSHKNFAFLAYLMVFVLFCPPANARIKRIVVSKSEPWLSGKSFGEAGTYIRITGRAYGEVDPVNPLNGIIQDISLTPRNEKGFVEYISDFIILRPADMTKSNGLLFLSLPNRGNAFPADTSLLRRGYIWFWCAWQGDVLPGGNRMIMKVPYASNDGKEITGTVRSEFEVMIKTSTLNLSSGFFSGSTHYSYETISLDNKGLTLTKRIHESDPRVPVPNSEWAFSDCSVSRFPGIPDNKKISLKEGFDPDYIYELIYTAKNPLVTGLGFAAIRDFSSFLRNELSDDAGLMNPLVSTGGTTVPVKAAVIQGVSQCSNFARTFLCLGFNQDEKGRKVFDGVNAHVGTRRISLNVRFGRPGGGGLQHEDHLFPGNDPPFTWEVETDSISGFTGGILGKCIETNTCPLIIQTVSSSEYWQLRASLTTTDPSGKRDLEIPANVRIYHFSGTQHSPVDAGDQLSGFQQNYNSYYPYLRALIVALEKWILEGKEPPPNTYPRLATGTLVKHEKEAMGWPDIPGIPFNGLANELPLLDYGPQYDAKNVTGTVEKVLPDTVSRHDYATLVPAVDKDGNETGGIRSISIRVPLGTYTGWALRREGFGKGDLAALNGMFIPFKKNRDERVKIKDPRASLKERYGTHEKYVAAVRQAADQLVKEGFLLPEDAEIEIKKAQGSDVLR